VWSFDQYSIVVETQNHRVNFFVNRTGDHTREHLAANNIFIDFKNKRRVLTPKSRSRKCPFCESNQTEEVDNLEGFLVVGILYRDPHTSNYKDEIIV